MYRDYEIFEVLPSGSPSRRAIVSGLEFAQATLTELAKRTRNECYAAEAKSHQIVAQMNVTPTRWRVFQIAYDEALGLARTKALRQLGCQVLSVVGNEKAKLILSSIQHYDLFILGDSGAEETRREMAGWLRTNYPNVKILALNSSQQPLPGADYNAKRTDPEKWLRIVTQR